MHVVVNLVRRTASPASVHMDRPRAQQACRQLEQEFGLRAGRGSRPRRRGARASNPWRSPSRDADGCRHPTERIPAAHTARQQLERVVRACATAASDERDFTARLCAEGVLVRPRYEQGSTEEVVGYSVALRRSDGERPVWFGGGRLQSGADPAPPAWRVA